MIPLDLSKTLANRKRFIDEVSDISVGHGTNLQPNKSMESFPLKNHLNASQFEPKSSTGFTGLTNQGATCYLNSLLQSLFMFKEFRRAVYEFVPLQGIETGTEFDNMDLARQLQLLFAHLQLSDRNSVSTHGLTHKGFGWTNQDSFVQQDVQECMSVIFDYVSTSCFGSSLSNFIEEKWSGQLYDRLVCKQCEKSRGSTTIFHDLQLQVRGQQTLEKSLETFCQDESLDDVQCSNCDRRGLHMKGMKLRKLPYALSLQLKRFDLDWNTAQKVKVLDELSIPLTLEMSNYIEIDHSSTESQVCDKNDNTYELLAVLVHSGSAYAGHYCCYIRDSSAMTENGIGRWYLFNDSTVTELTPKQFETAFGIEVGQTSSDLAENVSSTDNLAGFGISQDASGSPTKKQAINLISVKKNAYMLLYRKQDSTENLTDVPDILISSDLKQVVDRDNIEYHKTKAEWEYERQFLQIKVSYDNDIRLFKIHQSATVSDLTDMVWNEFFQSKQSNTIVRHCIRLRQYDSIRSVLLGPLANQNENPALLSFPEQVLRRLLTVEVKSIDDDFTDDNGEYLPLEVLVYIPTTWDPVLISSKADSFALPLQLSIEVNSEIKDLRRKVLQLTSSQTSYRNQGVLDDINLVNQISMCRIEIQTGQHIILNDDGNMKSSANGTSQLTDNQLITHLKGGDRIYVDLTKLYDSNLLPRDYLDMLTYFDRIYNMMTVSYTVFLPESSTSFISPEDLKHIGEVSGTGIGGPLLEPLQTIGHSYDIVMDARQTLERMKETIAAQIGLSASQFSLCKSLGGVPGKEMKDLSKTIRSETPPTESVLILAILLSPPLSIDQVRVHMYYRVISSNSYNTNNNINQKKDALAVEAYDLTSAVIRKSDLVRDVYINTAVLKALESMNISDVNPERLASVAKRLRYCTVDGKEKTAVSIAKDVLTPVTPILPSSDPISKPSSIPKASDDTEPTEVLVSDNQISNLKVLNPKEVLRDSLSIGSLLTTRLVDGCHLLVEIDFDLDTCTFNEDHIWIRLIVWNQKEDLLSKFFEVPLLKTLTFKELKEQVLTMQSIRSLLSEDVIGDNIQFGKPFTWQLENYQSNLPTLKWNSQPKDEDALGSAPWNLKDNAIILIKDSSRDIPIDSSAVSIDSSTSNYVSDGPETGFKLYSAKDRKNRDEAEAKELADKKAIMEGKIKSFMSVMMLRKDADN